MVSPSIKEYRFRSWSSVPCPRFRFPRSRFYRSVVIFRSLRAPISSRQCGNILSKPGFKIHQASYDGHCGKKAANWANLLCRDFPDSQTGSE